MSNPILNTIFKYPYDADLRLSFADEMLCEILIEKVELLKKSSLEIIAADDTLQIEGYCIRVGIIKPKSIIKLRYDKFKATGQEALLIFKIDNAKIITFLLNSIVSALKKIGKNTDTLVSLRGNSLLIDLFQVQKLFLPNIPIELFKSIQDIKMKFEQSKIKFTINLDHK